MNENRYGTALQEYSKNEDGISKSQSLDLELIDEYKALYDEIIYGLFFKQYASLTEAYYLGDIKSNILSEYVDFYEGVKIEQLSSETRQAMEEVVPEAVQRSRDTISEIVGFMRGNIINTKDTEFYVGLPKENVSRDFGSPSEIEPVYVGGITEDRVEGKEIWYYRENGNIVMRFDIGKTEM